jgi:CBS domain-containing protein
MNAKVRDLMTESVITVEPDATIDRVRRILQCPASREIRSSAR